VNYLAANRESALLPLLAPKRLLSVPPTEPLHLLRTVALRTLLAAWEITVFPPKPARHLTLAQPLMIKQQTLLLMDALRKNPVASRESALPPLLAPKRLLSVLLLELLLETVALRTLLAASKTIVFLKKLVKHLSHATLLVDLCPIMDVELTNPAAIIRCALPR